MVGWCDARGVLGSCRLGLVPFPLHVCFLLPNYWIVLVGNRLRRKMVNRSLVPPGDDQIPERVRRGQGDKPVPRGREGAGRWVLLSQPGLALSAVFPPKFSWEINHSATSLKSTVGQPEGLSQPRGRRGRRDPSNAL